MIISYDKVMITNFSHKIYDSGECKQKRAPYCTMSPSETNERMYMLPQKN